MTQRVLPPSPLIITVISMIEYEHEPLDELIAPPLSHDAHATTGTPMGVWQGGIATEYSTSPSSTAHDSQKVTD